MIDFGFDLAGTTDRRLYRGAVLSGVGALLQAAPVLVAFYTLDAVFLGRTDALSPLLLAAVLVFLAAADFGFRAAGMVDNFTASYGLIAATRLRLADHIRRLPMGTLAGRRVGELSSLLTDEFAFYTEIVTHNWGLVVANAALPMGLALVLLAADWRLALLALLPVPLAFLSVPWSYRLINRASDQLVDRKRAVIADVAEFVDGLPTLGALDATERFERRLQTELEELARVQMRAELAPAPAILLFGLWVHAGFALLMIGGAQAVEAAWIEPTRVVLLAMLGVYFTRNLAELVVYLAASRHAARTLERVRALFETEVQTEGTDPPSLRAEMAVEQVGFAYQETPALQQVTAGFPEGTVTALVGPSGSGKSTLAHLLCRLWDPDTGAIELGDVDLRRLPLALVHRRIATVFQQVVLFEESVLENVRLGRPEATREDVRRACVAAGAHDFIEALPQGYDTLLGPSGTGLSGGERQRLAIARALVKDAPILLLDEATASVDADREHEIQQAIGRLMQGRTVVVVAHRLWTVRDADQILVLDEGRVVERGSHAELLGAQGAYAAQWATQRRSETWSLGGPDA